MSSLYLKRLTPEARKELILKLHTIQNGNCFICDKSIDLSIHYESIDIDHITPTVLGGKDGEENFALTHASCNRSKQGSDLRVAKIMTKFNAMSERINRAPNLKDVLDENRRVCFPMKFKREGNILKYTLSDVGDNTVYSTSVYRDNLSGFEYIFLNLPIEYLHHDEHINPRSIGNNIRMLIEEFNKKNPQLHIALAWVDIDNNAQSYIYVFDGQHKAAAQILLGTKELPVRIFLNPDKDVLLTANTRAGTTLRQVAFNKSVQRSLGSSLLNDRLIRYRSDKNLPENGMSFSERDLINHFKGESKEMKRYILDWIRDSITNHKDNKLRNYIEKSGRSAELPISYSTVEKTFYSLFIFSDLLSTPFNEKDDVGENPRFLEITQIVKLMNIIAEEIYIDKYDHERGSRRIENAITKGEDIKEAHLIAYRMGKEEIMASWLKYINDIITTYNVHTGKNPSCERAFQEIIPDRLWSNIRMFIRSLKGLSLWINRDFASSIFGGKRNFDYWDNIFRTGKTNDGQPILTKGLNIHEMIIGDENL